MAKWSRQAVTGVLIAVVGSIGGVVPTWAANFRQPHFVPTPEPIFFPGNHAGHVTTITGPGNHGGECGSNLYLQPFFHYCEPSSPPGSSTGGGALELPDPIFPRGPRHLGWTVVSITSSGCEFVKDSNYTTRGHFAFEAPGATGPFGYCPSSNPPSNGGGSPPSNGGGNPPGNNTPSPVTKLVNSQNTAVPVTPMYFNGCEPRPALTSVEPAAHFVLAPGETAGTAITPPQPNTVAMGSEPQMAPGAVFSGQLTSAPALWDAMQNENATGQVLPGPMWGVVSQEWQNETINTYETINPQTGQVLSTSTQTVDDGAPYWVANESYNINSCPVPVPDFGSNG
ncbi:hypothetical protein [Sulfobacillus thermosulfidooxidans]|uniref:hypothetical protein n=1 Tax=Sulfobacillus thermosulfidooxidans TaxID=28034 RepID=UPI0006B5D345|nr:hypothetical protein [Sulfobacillus thermosulfidooxidans]